MGLRGPAPKPAELHRAQGTDRPDRHGEVAVQVGAKLLVAPAPAGLPPDVVEVWDEVTPVLLRAGMLAESDLIVLEALCTFLARAREARRLLVGEPLVVEGAKGGMVHNPLLVVERDAWASVHRLAVEFGMSPSARARLGIAMLTGRSLQQEMADRMGGQAGQPAAVAAADMRTPLTIEVAADEL